MPITDPATSSRMSRQATRDTTPEIALRRELHRRGFRYRVEYPVPGLPRRRIDIAFTKSKVAVFVDGCFWHSCPEHRTFPKANDAWWEAKLRKNVERDRETDAHLLAAGWTPLRIWEHEPAVSGADEIQAEVLDRGGRRDPNSKEAARPQASAASPSPTGNREAR